MKKQMWIVILLMSFLVVGCGSQSDENSLQETQQFLDAVETGIVETIAAAFPQTATSVAVDTPTVTPSPGSDDVSVVEPSLAPTQPSSAFTPTPTLLPTPCYRAELIDETIPDGTVITIGDGFTKTWVVQNTGVCAWNKDFTWKLVEGNDFRGETSLKFSSGDVMPGEVVSISIEMGSPFLPGYYRTIYKIFTDEGAEVTPNGFWIDVEVVEK